MTNVFPIMAWVRKYQVTSFEQLDTKHIWDGTRLMWHYIYAVYTNKQIQCYTCCMKLKITASCESIFFLFCPFSLFMSLWDITGVSSPFYFKVCNMTSHEHLEVFGTELFESQPRQWKLIKLQISFCWRHHFRCMIALCVILTIIHYFKYLNSFFMTGIVAACCCIWFLADTMTFVAGCLILLIICLVYQCLCVHCWTLGLIQNFIWVSSQKLSMISLTDRQNFLFCFHIFYSVQG